MTKLGIISALRGIAAFLVMEYHYLSLIPKEHPSKHFFDLTFGLGPAGVDLFFMISGFLMTLTTDVEEQKDWRMSRNFLLKRLIRIWPLYAIVSLGYYFLLNTTTYYPESVSRLVKSLIFLPLSTDDPPFLGHAFLLVGWTLNYEMYFYLLLGISLLFGRIRWKILFTWFLLTLVLGPVINHAFTLNPHEQVSLASAYLAMITNPIIWDFILGIVTGFLYIDANTKKWLESKFQHPAIPLIVTAAAVFWLLTLSPREHGLQGFGLPVFCLFFTLIFWSSSSQPHIPNSLLSLGNISYSVYLLHLPVLVLMNIIFRRVGIPTISPVFKLTFFTAITLLLSNVSYTLIEKQLGEYLRKHLIKRT